MNDLINLLREQAPLIDRGYAAELMTEAAGQLNEARELLLHFQFIAHGPGCACVMCEKRAAWLARFTAETEGDANVAVD